VKLARKVACMEHSRLCLKNIKEGDQREVFCADKTKKLKWILEKHK
jgi:hypothetical protein